jgi:hypothetical protein
MRRSIREVNMNMIDSAALEIVGKVKGITRTLLCLRTGTIFLLMPVNQVARPFALRFRALF